jgi:hypothetical protein
VRPVKAAHLIAVRALVVEAPDESGAAFYEHVGFTRIEAEPPFGDSGEGHLEPMIGDSVSGEPTSALALDSGSSRRATTIRAGAGASPITTCVSPNWGSDHPTPESDTAPASPPPRGRGPLVAPRAPRRDGIARNRDWEDYHERRGEARGQTLVKERDLRRCRPRGGGDVSASTRLARPTVVRTQDVDGGLLGAAGLELERFVMLEPTEQGLTLRRLTVEEKIDHSQQTGEAAFLGSDEEQEEFFAALAARPSPNR